MKKMLFALMMMVGVPFLTMAQDDLYFVPKKKAETKETGTSAKVVVENSKTPTTVYTAPGTAIVVKDTKGKVRDVDEYNRRYTSRDNTFDYENDTLYIEEKPLNERGEWVNGFDGSQDDYEYAMRIVRFRNPRFAIHVSSPYYWEVVHMLPSWEWNVFDDGLFAYAFPTYFNPMWWDWRWNYPITPSLSFSFNYYTPWSTWYNPYWHGASYWAHYMHHAPWHYHWHHHVPLYGGVGGYWGSNHGWYGSTALRPGRHAGRYVNSYNRNVANNKANDNRRLASTQRNDQDKVNAVRQSGRTQREVSRGNVTQTNRKTTAGRVVTSRDGSTSVRPSRTVSNRTSGNVGTKETTTTRSNSSYTRSTQRRGSSYDRPSSTRSSVNNASTPSYQRKNATSGRNSSVNTSRTTRSNSAYSSGSSSRSSSSGSFSSGGGSSRSSGGGGGSRSGGGSRGGRR